MDSLNELEVLQKIQKVAAPTDLYHKVCAGIKPSQQVSSTLSIAASIAFFLLAATNIWFVSQNLTTQQEYDADNGYYETILSNDSNQLYNE